MNASAPQIDPAKYEVGERIGSGGFSHVFRARQVQFDRDVAIKVMNASLEDARARKTFDHECKVMGRFSDADNIVTVFDSGYTADDRPFIVMELCETTYRDMGVLPVEDAVFVGAKVARALATLHDDGVIHRDIKPHNIFVNRRGQPALGDFGISSVVSERSITGGAGFSVQYAAPEVFDEAGGAESADVYALGASLYQMLSGSVPFPTPDGVKPTLRETVARILNAPAPLVSRPDAPKELVSIVQRCMAKDPDGRPASAAALAEDLEAVARSLDLNVELPRAMSSTTTQPEPPVGADEARQTFTIPRRGVAPQPSDAPPTDATTDEEDTSTRRPALLAVFVGIAVVAAIIGIAVFGGEADTDESPDAPTTSAAVDSATPPLLPPQDVSAVVEGDLLTVSWSPDDNAVLYRVTIVGGEEFEVEAPPATIPIGDAATPCVEVVAVGDRRQSFPSEVACP